MPRIIGFGSALLDQLAYVPEDFLKTVPGAKGGTELIDDVQRTELLARLPAPPELAPGGSAANTIIGLGHLGLPGRLLAKLGDDEAGKAYRHHALAAGVDSVAFKQHPDLPTGTCLSLVTPDSERTMRTFLGAAATISTDDVTAADIAGCSHLHAEGYMLFNRELMLHVLQLGQAGGCSIGLDLSSPEVVEASADFLPDILSRYVDIAYANEAEAETFTGSGDPHEALRALSSLCSIAVVKLGIEGALISDHGEVHHIPAERVKARDTTGAGDLWAAGFLYGHLSGWPLNRAGKLGAAVAARVVQVTGAAMPDSIWCELRTITQHMNAADPAPPAGHQEK